MKRFLSTLFIIGLIQSGFAQWTANPGNPLRVCSKNSNQTGVWTFPDGNGGAQVFWLDDRNGGGTSDIALVGQHLDANGNKLLPDTGKVVVFNPALKTSHFGIAKDPSGNFWIAWTLTTQTRMDSMVLQKFNKTTLNPIWNKTKTIAKINATSFNALYTESIRLLPIGDSLNMVYHVTWMGGSSVKFLNRASAQGEIRFGVGKQLPGPGLNHGPSVALVNPDGTMFLIQREGNGAGTGVVAWKFDKNLKTNWGAKSLTTGTTGLSNPFEVNSDGNNGFIMGYISNSSDDYMAIRVDSAGNFVWNPAHKPICNFSSSQSSPDMELSNGILYAVWNDNRPPASNSDVYMQKIDISTGERLWNPNGRRIFRLNSYIPTPKIRALNNGDLIVTSFQSSTGFVAQKVKPDSSLVWPGYGMLISTEIANSPFYGAYGLSNGNNGNVFVAWQNPSSKILIAGAADNGTLITENEAVLVTGQGVQLFPNPNSGRLYFKGLSGTRQKVTVTDAIGRVVLSAFMDVTQEEATLDHQLKQGLYMIRIGKEQMRMVVR